MVNEAKFCEKKNGVDYISLHLTAKRSHLQLFKPVASLFSIDDGKI